MKRAHCEKARTFGLALIWMASLASPAWGQTSWTSGANYIYYSSGNVGIGTSSPAMPLDVNGPVRSFQGSIDVRLQAGAGGGAGIGSFSSHPLLVFAGGLEAMRIMPSGNVGIGTNNPVVQLHVSGSSGTTQFLESTGSGVNWLQFKNTFGMAYVGQLNSADYFLVNTTAAGSMNLGTNNLTRMVIASSGNVGIGTANPQYRLAVNGSIGAKDVIVTNTGWSDYVFRPGYRLRPLSEVSAFIQANHHLPDIPSEAEVKEKGVSVGEMQSKLLAKIEELTLHMIQQDKENQQLRERLAQLETRAGGR